MPEVGRTRRVTLQKRTWASAGILALALPMPALGLQNCGRADVGEHDIHYCVEGAADITVVLAAGTGQTSGTFTTLAADLADHARVVTFDRPGMGQSEPGPAPAPRSPTVIATELSSLLEALQVEGPLVLVGHSAGGWHMLRLAERIPDRIIGVVLLDTPPPTFEAQRMTLLTPAEQTQRAQALAYARARANPTLRAERDAAPRDLARGFQRFPRHVPLTAVVANGQEFGAGEKNAAHRDLWVELSQRWEALTDHPRVIIAEGSGHMVHHDQPELVVQTITEVLRTARR